jgi:hypothetical protein
MDEQRDRLEVLLEAFKNGTADIQSTREAVQGLYFKDLGHTKLDIDREKRTGYPEVVYCGGKNPEQIRDIFSMMVERGIDILGTRMSSEAYEIIAGDFPGGEYYPDAKIFTMRQTPWKDRGKGEIGIVSAGTSDGRVAQEAAVTASFYGHRVKRYNDVGVAGIHRLFGKIDEIRQSRVIVAVAGMEGALPGVLAGLVSIPIIAVPTSVGYGANFQGLSALLTMINSCAAGISVVNIDNGFGAGYLAAMINGL